MTTNLDCHWCANLEEPHEAHALAKGHFDLVVDLDRERQDNHARVASNGLTGVTTLV